ncbi:MAG: MmgE/PrpD family protein [Betaproteobacteria bacterium]|nr:MmgE/PrpD family protein [Betaproteobacteria bacterium]
MPNQVTETLGRFAAETGADRIPPAALSSAKLKFLDTLAVAVAGSRHRSSIISFDVTRQLGGNPHCTVIGRKERASVEHAGYLNAVSAHALEYDDYTKSVTHASVCLVPGALALAEWLGASGRAMLDAFVFGFETESRIARGMRPWLLDRGWHPNGILGGIGVAVIGSRLMGLDQLTLRMAIGIAASEGSGLRKNVGSMGKAFHVGHGVRCGVFAAMLAAKGFKVDPDVIEGNDDGIEGHDRFGLADTFNGVGNHDLGKMTERLGERWELAENTTNVRLHPGSTAPGAAIDSMIDLAKEHDICPADVEKIELECTPQCLAIASYSTANDSHKARFCLPYSMAVSLLDRRAGITQYTDERVNRDDVQSLMKRVVVRVPDDLRHHWGQWGQAGVNWGEMRLAVTLRGGAVLRTARSTARGWSEDPATWDDLADKFRECSEHVLSAAQVDEALHMISRLEQLSDLKPLLHTLQVDFDGRALY